MGITILDEMRFVVNVKPEPFVPDVIIISDLPLPRLSVTMSLRVKLRLPAAAFISTLTSSLWKKSCQPGARSFWNITFCAC